MAQYGVAVLGLGRMGLIHVKTLLMSPRASVKWIVRNDLEAAQKFVSSMNLHAKCATPDKLEPVLEDPSVHAVVICSPSSIHKKQISEFLHANKAVFCEKPVTPDIESTKACYDMAARNGKPLFCAFHRRYDHGFRQMRDAIHSGKFGRLRLLKEASHDLAPPPVDYVKSSGGIFVDSTIHDLDMSLWTVGSKPVSLFACGNAFDPEVKQAGDFDLVNVIIKYENGVVSIIDNGRVSGWGYDQRIEAKCDEGHLALDNPPFHPFHLGTTAPPIHDDCMTRYSDAYRKEMEHFLDVLEGNAELGVTSSDTLEAMRLAEACKKSAQLGRSVDL